jgi:hypothetical protein
VDRAGNITTQTFIYDITSPVIEGIDDLNKEFYRDTFEVEFKDLVSGLKVIEVKFKQTSEEGYKVETVLNDRFRFNKSGYYMIYLEDKESNTTLFNFTLDMSPPVVTSTPNQDISNSSVTVSIEDNLSGVKVVIITKDLEPFYEGTNVVHTFSQHGRYIMYVEDNSSNGMTNEIIIDKVKPQITLFNEIKVTDELPQFVLIPLIKDQKLSGVIRLEFSDDYEVLEIKYFKDNQITPLTTVARFVTLEASGVYRFIVIDKAGNEFEHIFTLDNIGPVINTQVTERGGYLITVEDALTSDVTTTINGKDVENSIELKLPGIYEIISTDQLGNESVKNIEIELTEKKVYDLLWLKFNGLKFNNKEEIFNYALNLYNYREVISTGSQLEQDKYNVEDFESIGTDWDVNKSQTFYLIDSDESKAYLDRNKLYSDLRILIDSIQYTRLETYFENKEMYFNNTYYAKSFNLNTFLGNQMKVVNLNDMTIIFDDIVTQSIFLPPGIYEIVVSDEFFTMNFELVIVEEDEKSSFIYIPSDENIIPTEIKNNEIKFFSYSIEIESNNVPLGAIMEVRYSKDTINLLFTSEIYDLGQFKRVNLAKSGRYEVIIVYYDLDKEKYEELSFAFEIINEKPSTLVDPNYSDLSYLIRLDTAWFNLIDVDAFTFLREGKELKNDDFGNSIQPNTSEYLFFDNQKITIRYRVKTVNYFIIEEINLKKIIAKIEFKTKCDGILDQECIVTGATNKDFDAYFNAQVPEYALRYNFDFEEGHSSNVPDSEIDINFRNIHDGKNLTFTLRGVSGRANNILPGDITSRALSISPIKVNNNLRQSYVDFDFIKDTIVKLEFDTYFINALDESSFTKYELQVWNSTTNEWIVLKDILKEISGTQNLNNISVENFTGTRFRFYAEGVNSGEFTAKVMLDNVKAYIEEFTVESIELDNSKNSLRLTVNGEEILKGNIDTFKDTGIYTFELKRGENIIASSNIEIDLEKKLIKINEKSYEDGNKVTLNLPATITFDDCSKISVFRVNADDISKSSSSYCDYPLTDYEEYEISITDHAGNLTTINITIEEKIGPLLTTEAWIAIISGIVALLTLIVTIIAVKKRS